MLPLWHVPNDEASIRVDALVPNLAEQRNFPLLLPPLEEGAASDSA